MAKDWLVVSLLAALALLLVTVGFGIMALPDCTCQPASEVLRQSDEAYLP